MKEDRNNITNIFQSKLDGYKVPVQDHEWEKLGIKLKKANFFRFSPFRFNIYYTGMIAAGLIISLSLFTKDLLNNNKTCASVTKTDSTSTIRQNEKSVQQQKANVISGLDVKAEAEEKNTSNKTTKDKFVPKNNETVKPDNLADSVHSTKDKVFLEPVKQVLLHDTLSLPSNPKEFKVHKPQRRKVVHIIKQDTVIVVDSIDRKKRR